MILKNAYKFREERKRGITYVRMDKSMIKQLQEIKELTGISKSELVREAVRRLIAEIQDQDDIRITI